MKKIFALLLLLSPSAHADFSYQIENVIGDWDFGSTSSVFKIQKQTEDSLKVYVCNRASYLAQSGVCSYSKIILYRYNSNFDGFCYIGGSGNCESGIQVSLQYPTEMLEIVDPLNLHRFSNSGYSIQANKK